MDLLNGLLSVSGIGAILVMLGSHAFLFDVADSFKTYAKGGSFALNFNFGSSTQEILTRVGGALVMVWGFWTIGAQKLIPFMG